MEGGETLGKTGARGFGEEGSVGGGPSPLSLPTATDLERPGPVGLLPAKVELSSHRQAHKEPVAEAEVVDEQEDILHGEVDECHGALEGEGGSSRGQRHPTPPSSSQHPIC